jgi:RNA polymerase sigma-70 factor (ECF subfamily)
MRHDEEIAGLLRGDRRAVRDVRRVVTHVVRAFRRFPPDEAKDLVQETLTRLLLNLRAGRFRGEASLHTYAQTIAKYTCLEYLRRRRLEPLPGADGGFPGPNGPEADLLRGERQRARLRAFASLPRQAQRLLLMIFVEGLTYEQVGARLHLSESAIKSRVHRYRLLVRRACARATRSRRNDLQETSR